MHTDKIKPNEWTTASISGIGHTRAQLELPDLDQR
jgi:hypothetical protein